MATMRADALTDTVDVLTSLATGPDRGALDELRTRVSDRRLRILVAGEAKRGKSTLVNRLLGTDVLPVGVLPLTAVATTVRRQTGSGEQFVTVRFRDGRQARYDVSELAQFVTEAGNPENVRDVAGVDVVLGAGPMDEYQAELVDTPGTGSVHEHNTSAAHEAFDSLDAAIFVASADPPMSAAERDLLADVTRRSVRTFVVLNKADQLEAADLDQAVEFTRSICAAVTGVATTVYACSARAGDADAGYIRFRDELYGYLASRAGADVDTALRGHVSRLARAMLDAVVLTRRALELAESTSADRVRLFSERITQVAERRHELDDRCWAIERGLRRDLDRSAAELRDELIPDCREHVVAALDGELAGLPPEELEARGRDLVIAIIRDRVDAWRSREADTLESGLTAICDRVVEEYEAHMAELRDAAHELLDVTLTGTAHTGLLRASHRFWYAFDRPVALEPPLAATVRRVAPGRARRARARVLDDIAELVDRQVGRARADLQQRLQESIRGLLAGLQRDHSRVIERLRDALTESIDLSTTAGERRRTASADLGRRTQMLRATLVALSPGAPDVVGT